MNLTQIWEVVLVEDVQEVGYVQKVQDKEYAMLILEQLQFTII